MIFFCHLIVVDCEGNSSWHNLTRTMCALETGFDINAGPVWLEYISFLKAAPVSSHNFLCFDLFVIFFPLAF